MAPASRHLVNRPQQIQALDDRLWAQIEDLPDGSFILQVDVNEPREVGWWALQWGASAEVLEPESLRREMTATAKALVATYET